MYNREFTPERISELKPNEIFVFGSNLAGSHGGGVDVIKPYVDEFIEFAKAHPEYKFLATKVGCGIAGWKIGAGNSAKRLNGENPIPKKILQKRLTN